MAANLAAGALGSQTGDSLYAPASGASLVTLRGTDGLESGSGIMPLSWLTDFGGAMARSVGDLADILNVVTGTDPADPTTAPADAERPADWRSVLDANALQGKRIGYIPSTWEDPFGTTGTIAASKAALKYLTDAGATIVEMGSTVGDANTPPAPPNNPSGNTTQEGLDAVHRRASGTGRAGLPDPQRRRRELLAEEGLVHAPGPEHVRRGARRADDRRPSSSPAAPTASPTRPPPRRGWTRPAPTTSASTPSSTRAC